MLQAEPTPVWCRWSGQGRCFHRESLRTPCRRVIAEGRVTVVCASSLLVCLGRLGRLARSRLASRWFDLRFLRVPVPSLNEFETPVLVLLTALSLAAYPLP